LSNPKGILLLQLGTPDAPTAKALRPYLREFLGDPRVIEPPKSLEDWPRLWRALWWCVLNGPILLRRPARSAAKYTRIWSEQTGMPLLHYTRRQAEELQRLVANSVVRFAMRYGNPSIASVLHEMVGQGIERIIVMNSYPQYSGTTTASALDGLLDALKQERRIPSIRVVPPYYEHPAYLDAMATLIREELAKLPWEPEFHVLSFHGIPQLYVQRGDPYALHVERTAQALAKRLGWKKGQWARAYQSLFGKAAWLKPYTEEKCKELAKRGIRRLFVATPGFTADCLETIDEVGLEIREIYAQAGGKEFHRCPCLNDHPQWIEAMRTIVVEEGRAWLDTPRTNSASSFSIA
jgi:ferrochelatase